MTAKYKVSEDVMNSFHDGHGSRVIHHGDLICKVCVPFDMPDSQVEKFANDEHLKEDGVWKLIPGDHSILGDEYTRASCVMHEDHVHMNLEFHPKSNHHWPAIWGKALWNLIFRKKKPESMQKVSKRAGWWDERD